MTLTPTLTRPATSPYGKRMYTVGVNEIKQGGAFTSTVLTLESLPAGSVHLASRIKHTAALVGPSISAGTARLSFNGTALGAGALDIFAAPGTTDGTHSITSITPVVGDAEAANPLVMTITSTGANLNVATAGEIVASINYIIVPVA